ncbi:MAG TPA: 16S rRNA (adenine(1518)-N(6)/adenine(1519)-N(6))-dimethyltransferase RsmA [Gammaproteobacteria bacterium]|nr:16S rRNA (adenine(1518)-N(6)/adenine(1519)-N(6))-dimethyltransferase RsmA [Gammaproteobacteria bacterium]
MKPSAALPLRPKKRFGQHFLRDPTVIAQLLAAIDPRPGQRLVEIGPGTGALTLPLLKALGELDAVELDRDLAAELRERCRAAGELRVHVQDALKFEFCALCTDNRPLRLVGNLPYNISTPLLFHLLTQIQCLEEMIFMLQKEVGDRLAAPANTPHYGRLSVMIQYHCTVETLFDVAPSAFYPPPQVHSSVLRLQPKRPQETVLNQAIFDDLVKRAFSLRRKTLGNALKGRVDTMLFRMTGIDPQRRGETLSIGEFILLANQLAKHAGDS